MDANRVMKIKAKIGDQTKAKRMNFPPDFKSLLETTKDFIPLNDSTKCYKFVQEKDGMVISNESDYEKLKSVNETVTKINIDIVDINELNKSESNSNNINNINNVIQSSVQQVDILKSGNIFIMDENLNKKENDEELDEEEDLIKSKISPMLKEKLKKLEDCLVEELYKSYDKQINNQNNKLKKEENVSERIHKGISCSNCGEKDIKGIRYKCTNCSNYDLCEKCEKMNCHDISHILIKIRYPNLDEREFNSKIDTTLSYKNSGYNYSVEPLEIKFNKGGDNYSQQIILKNIGKKPWKENFKFQCLQEDSDIIGKDIIIEKKINEGSQCNLMLIFEDVINQLNNNIKKEYNCFYQLFMENDETFGNITKFKITFV